MLRLRELRARRRRGCGSVFYLTVRHDQVVKLAQQYLP
jgi:hypothetical protein